MRASIAAVFHKHAESCRILGSRFNFALITLLASRLERDSAFARRIDDWDETSADRDALAIRAMGGLHALARSGRAPAWAALYPTPITAEQWPTVARTIQEHDAFLLPWLDGPPQTNEVGRSGILLGTALWLRARFDMPMKWWEIGASAGLNLGFPDYAYDLDVGTWGSAGVLVKTRWDGAHPALDQTLELRERAGCDVAPRDPVADRERLLSYIWPDQFERLERTTKALDYIANTSLRVERAPASQWLADKLAQACEPGVLRVVAHTIVWQYLPKDERDSIRATLSNAQATEQTPVAWVAVEGNGDPKAATISVTLWPGGSRNELGRADYHGRWASWS